MFVESRSNKLAKEIPFVNYKEFKFDKNGIPVLSANQIEIFANEVLNWFDADLLFFPKRIPVFDIIQKFTTEYDIKFIPNTDLGETEAGDQILGKCLPDDRIIYISSALLDEENRLRFTVAHELGHLLLHRALKLKKKMNPNINEDTEIVLDTGRKKPDFLEWQAKCFAANLLLPRKPFLLAFIEKQMNMGIKRNIGRIIIDNTRYSASDYREICNCLALRFGLSTTCIKFRLENLQIIKDTRD